MRPHNMHVRVTMMVVCQAPQHVPRLAGMLRKRANGTFGGWQSRFYAVRLGWFAALPKARSLMG